MDSGQWGKTVQLFYYFGSGIEVLQMMKDFATKKIVYMKKYRLFNQELGNMAIT